MQVKSPALKGVLTAVIFALAIFMVIQMVLQYNKVHYGDVWIADLYVEAVDVNGNPVAAYIIVFEQQPNGDWLDVKEKQIYATGEFQYVDSFAPTSVSGKSYKIHAMTSDMKMFGAVEVMLIKGRNEVTITLKAE
jgi:hypothetical protein